MTLMGPPATGYPTATWLGSPPLIFRPAVFARYVMELDMQKSIPDSFPGASGTNTSAVYCGITRQRCGRRRPRYQPSGVKSVDYGITYRTPLMMIFVEIEVLEA